MTPRPYHRPAWATRPAVVIGSGPSLSDEQLQSIEQAHLEERVHVLAVNNTIERAPWADVAYFGDYSAIKHYRPKLAPLTGAEWVTIDRAAAERWKLTHVKAASANGISLQRVHVNGNSGAQAINVAAAFGATRIVLVGFDMRDAKDGSAHWFGQHPAPLVRTQLYEEWLHKFETIARDAKQLGVEIVNATPGSALDLFPHVDLNEALA
jgi:hypothetical protein